MYDTDTEMCSSPAERQLSPRDTNMCTVTDLTTEQVCLGTLNLWYFSVNVEFNGIRYLLLVPRLISLARDSNSITSLTYTPIVPRRAFNSGHVLVVWKTQ
ncbi:hypothetical protein BaRGS_00022076 [Batillaria attramentaria]|uniref:Uncharacterized protein n=1 Tax=Batillaria attramentaria TaxID=370345 RepID=A0ABD0KHJ5_9CAEN